MPAFAYTKLKNSYAKQVKVNQKPCTRTPIDAEKSIYNARPPSKQFQTDFVSSETTRRVESILSGPHSSAFCQIMVIFVSGYWKLNFDADLLSVRFVCEEKK